MDNTPDPPGTPALLDVMLHMLDRHDGRDIRVSDMLQAMGDRGFGFALIAFGMLAAVLPTGLCSIMSMPIILFSAQLLFGQSHPSIPARFNNRTFAADRVQASLRNTEKWLRRLEAFAKPRWSGLTGPFTTRLAAFFCLTLALVIIVPGPFTNLPPGIAIALFGFAMAERDGLLMLLSFATAILAFFISLSAISALAVLTWVWASHYFL
ncbi:MAG TPA: exopolysaccharide biosynthesis protein [Arenimonas sp.]|nr:exopolysaccharide biosynthesis protein [Arenimonas sp.]